MNLNDPTTADRQQALRWARVRAALAEGLGETGDARAAFLQRLRADKPDIADEVAELLALGDEPAGLIDQMPSRFVEELVNSRAERHFEGRRFGAWRVGRLLGRGGMGDVYLGERADGAFRMQVAVKVLKNALPADADISRFERERHILASLEHVNLAKIIDGGVTDEGVPYFVMEFVSGVPLDDYCEQTSATLAQRIGLLRTVCQVVHYVNQRGVVHRDLKPRNILVTPDGVVKLLDFGIATRLGDDAAAVAHEHTATSLRSMTLLYSSPEQVRGDPVGPTSDVYALGVVMFRLLAASTPYDLDAAQSSSFELARAICETEPRRLSDAAAAAPEGRSLAPPLRGDLDAIAAKALRKDPAARYASAEALADDLFRQQSTLPVRARRGALSYRVGRWLLKHRAFVVGALVVNLVLVAGIAVSLHQAREARLQRERAERNFASVRKLANVFLFDFHDAVASLPGSMAARRMVVDEAQTYLGALAADADVTADPALTLELAVSYRKIGDIQGWPNSPNLGDAASAVASYERSQRLLAPLIASGRPADVARARLELGNTLGHKVSTLSFSGQSVPAQRAVQESLDDATEILKTDPDRLEALLLRASSYGALSWIRHEQGDMAGFESNLEHSERLLTRILEAHPDNADVMFKLATNQARRGVYYFDRDKSVESARLALPALRRWVDIMSRLRVGDPANPRYTGGLAEADEYLGMALQRVGDGREAVAALDRCLEMLAIEARLDPSDDDVMFRITSARTSIATLLLEQDDPLRARDYAQQAIASYDGRPATAREAIMNLHDGAQAHFISGRIWNELARRSHAAPAQAADLRAKACREFRASLGLMARMKDVPASSNGELSKADVEHETVACSR